MTTKEKKETFENAINDSINKTEDINDIIGFIEIEKISRKLKETAKSLTPNEARYLTDAKIQIQNFRIRIQNQLRACKQEYDEDNVVNNNILEWLFNSIFTIEKEIIKALDIYTSASKAGRWIKSNLGIGPVLAAGLLANFDVTKCTYAGQFWSYAGLNDNNIEWLGASKSSDIVDSVIGKSRKITEENLQEIAKLTGRSYTKIHDMAYDEKKGKYDKKSLKNNLAKLPYNAQLKSLCYLIGGQFMRLKHNNKSLYAKLFFDRLAYETKKNDEGKNKDYADMMLKKYKYDKNKDTYKSLEQGKLSKAHLVARARRYTVKIFISHLFEALYYFEYNKKAPEPYIFSHGDKGSHYDYIAPEVDYLNFE